MTTRTDERVPAGATKSRYGRRGRSTGLKEHAVRTERKGRPAHDIGDRSLAEAKDPDAR